MPTPNGERRRKCHRRESSLWVPLSRPAITEPVEILRHKTETGKQQIGDFLSRRCLLCCPTLHTTPEFVPLLLTDCTIARYQILSKLSPGGIYEKYIFLHIEDRSVAKLESKYR